MNLVFSIRRNRPGSSAFTPEKQWRIETYCIFKVVIGISRCPDLEVASYVRKLYLVLRFTAVVKLYSPRNGTTGSLNYFAGWLY